MATSLYRNYDFPFPNDIVTVERILSAIHDRTSGLPYSVIFSRFETPLKKVSGRGSPGQSSHQTWSGMIQGARSFLLIY